MFGDLPEAGSLRKAKVRPDICELFMPLAPPIPYKKQIKGVGLNLALSLRTQATMVAAGSKNLMALVTLYPQPEESGERHCTHGQKKVVNTVFSSLSPFIWDSSLKNSITHI